MEELKKTRDSWLKAFLEGDTQKLAEIEASDFAIISENGIETTDKRNDMIDARKSSDQWFKSSAQYGDEQVDYQDLGDVVTVKGMNQILANGKLIRSSFVSEVWQRDNGSWKIALAHATNNNRF